ncbi:hypothetical protein HRM2_47960 [Desulforapulum autotrophicum HRM2]|uniref:Uncharacterized protein n=1 Tax=Desulforapulum autotrophicum (strain ATCC 43914 / DSM 3382 / VKM B-1955 / HRM2) TaxID=177437 RepID=C0QHI6_DESAH|nr:hypothetical protein [Desulforapulum autotrophicum]ACN17845.1 hypothetical protein HRM2_47960 [Desulforapulum autotrophicum HRM2]
MDSFFKRENCPTEGYIAGHQNCYQIATNLKNIRVEQEGLKKNRNLKTAENKGLQTLNKKIIYNKNKPLSDRHGRSQQFKPARAYHKKLRVYGIFRRPFFDSGPCFKNNLFKSACFCRSIP